LSKSNPAIKFSIFSIVSKTSIKKSTHSTPRAETRGMLRVNTERRFYPDLKIGVWRRRTYQKMEGLQT
jgi:hypothetical protein